MNLKKFEDKKILILGFGREGKSALRFFQQQFPQKIFGIADENPGILDPKIKNVKWYLGSDYLKALKEYDLIIKSPGVPIHLPKIEKCFKEKKIISPTQIFFENFPGKIIGVTGTKGKSTTTSLIFQVLKTTFKNIALAGNIGRPLLDILSLKSNKTLVVCELSSHQLFNLKNSPHVAVFLNFYPEHLDYYKDLQEYLQAKANIALWQKETDFFIYNSAFPQIKKIAKLSKAKKIPIINPEKIVKDYKIKTPFLAPFYFLNMSVAIKVGEIFNIEREKIKLAIENFRPLPHRLELVGSFKGITFFNDSLSTIPETTIFALRSFKGKIGSLILGGFDRGVDFEHLAKEIVKHRVKVLIFFPDSGERIWQEILKINSQKPPRAFFVKNMSEAVKIAFEFTPKGKICLLSPASPSFGLFLNYKERGNMFKKYVKIYGKK